MHERGAKTQIDYLIGATPSLTDTYSYSPSSPPSSPDDMTISSLASRGDSRYPTLTVVTLRLVIATHTFCDDVSRARWCQCACVCVCE